MQKSLLLKLGGFVTALCATGALVAVTVPATGAYFSDARAGSVAGQSGHLKLTTSPAAPNVSFAALTPGEKTPQRIDYAISSTGPSADIWLVFTKNSSQFQDFTGGKGSPLWTDGGLGRYGYFAVSTGGAPVFRSGNLSYADGTNSYAVGTNCQVDAYGRGGSDWENHATASPLDVPSAYCGVPDKILLAQNVTSGSIFLTLGLNIAYSAQDDRVIKAGGGSVPFQIVAVQHQATPIVS